MLQKLISLFYNPQNILKNSTIHGEIPDNKSILNTTLKMAWPSTLESFMVAIVGVIDTIMVSSLGESAIAAVGLSNQPKFLGLCIFFANNIAISAIVARRKGEKDREKAQLTLKHALIFTFIVTAIISTIFFFFSGDIITFVGANEDTHADATIYLKIIMSCMIFHTVSLTINAAQRGAGNTKIAMRTNLVSNLVNVVFNYLLIGGNFGFPALGVAGAALASVLGTIVACGMSLASVLTPQCFVFLDLRKKFKYDHSTVKAMYGISGSALCEQISIRIGFLVFSMIVANLGTIAFAAHQVGNSIMSLSFSFADGLSVAAVALVGQSLGQKRPDLAKLYGALCQRIGFCISLVLAVIFFFFGTNIYALFSERTDILEYGVVITNMISLIVLLQIAQVIYSGCLRGAGDTRYIAVVSLVSVTLIRPAASFLLCYPLGFGLYGAWVGLILDQFMRLVFANVRFKKGKWANIKL